MSEVMETTFVVEVPAAPVEIPVAFRVFEETLRPPKLRNKEGRVIGLAGPGAPDEIWLNWIRLKHGNERHSLPKWRSLIDQYRDVPAHPAGVI